MKVTKSAGMAALSLFFTMPAVAQNEQEVHNVPAGNYRGFVEVGYTLSRPGTSDRVEVLTTHGMQVVPHWFYFGMGTGLQVFTNVEDTAVGIPLFVDFRTEFLSGNSPFIDLKIGYTGMTGTYNSFREGGFYFTPSAGMRFALNGRRALNFSIGYTYQKATLYKATYDQVNPNMILSEYSKRGDIGGVTFKIGYEF